MNTAVDGELVWHRTSQRIQLGLYVAPGALQQLGDIESVVQVSSTQIPLLDTLPSGIVYRHPIRVTADNGKLTAGPVYAILAAAGAGSFIGSRSNFRDIAKTAKERRRFVYVVPDNHVSTDGSWQGYVRLGYRRWLALPCPRPEVVYNRIPNRKLEASKTARQAKQVLATLDIPVFNPGYFNKAVIYDVIRKSKANPYLPQTAKFQAAAFRTLLARYGAVYLKPAGGSIGQGIMRAARTDDGFQLTVVRDGHTQTFVATNLQALWQIVNRERARGPYVVQRAISMIHWNQRPCDFRVLLQKWHGEWNVVGIGVRVMGPQSITTHVPNGGSIAEARKVFATTFGDRASEVEREMVNMATMCAIVIDAHYGQGLGEMSMDIGADRDGNLWFFEANAKPMKFDEPEIRERSLTGVVTMLDDFRSKRRANAR